MLKNKKEAKRLYDIEYRRKNNASRKLQKSEYYQKNKGSINAKERLRRSLPGYQESHNEYCMQPDYVKKKRIWDVVYRNIKRYGDFWEVAILVNQIEIEVRKLVPKNERLSYRRCVVANTKRNCDRRFVKVISEIENGESVGADRIRSFKGERKEFLKELLINLK